jgi:predicted amidohydrolase YtcJ
VRRLITYLSERGVVALYDGGNFGHEDRVYALLAKLEREGDLPLRYRGTYQIFASEQRREAIAQTKRLQQRYGGERLRFDTIKLFMDGVGSSRTAAMLAPYADAPEVSGDTMLSAEELTDFLLELDDARLDLHVHVLGDRAVRTVLEAVETARRTRPDDFYPRVTLAHLGLVDPADFPRIAALGIVANYTPQWHGVVKDDPIAQVFGSERYGRTLLVRPLLDAGGIVSFSSDDWGVADLSPFLGMQVGHLRAFPAARASVLTTTPSIRGPASERLDLETMLRGYTINGAYQLRMDDEIGSIETGKRADFVVLDEDLFAIDPERIHAIVPSAVVMDGALVRGTMR